MSENIFHIVYGSKNMIHANFIDLELPKILKSSRKSNKDNNITGALIYSKLSFVQILEGNIKEIENTFEKIQRDNRHSEIIVIKNSYVSYRIFGKWDMALVNADKSTLSENFIDLSRNSRIDIMNSINNISIMSTNWLSS